MGYNVLFYFSFNQMKFLSSATVITAFLGYAHGATRTATECTYDQQVRLVNDWLAVTACSDIALIAVPDCTMEVMSAILLNSAAEMTCNQQGIEIWKSGLVRPTKPCTDAQWRDLYKQLVSDNMETCDSANLGWFKLPDCSDAPTRQDIENQCLDTDYQNGLKAFKKIYQEKLDKLNDPSGASIALPLMVFAPLAAALLSLL